MKRILVLFLISVIGMQSVQAQNVAEPADASEGAAVEANADPAQDPDFRNTRAYSFPALSRTVRDMQYLAYAFQLRDYCADQRVPDAFVRVQLARFSLITGREESCRTLTDY